jgi:transcriptional regulator with XRE-family HTH domain
MDRDIRAAGAAVAAAAGELGWSQTQLAQRAEVDSGTLGDFLAGRRWPRNTTQAKVERALGWPSGTIAQIATGGTAPVVKPTPHDVPVGSGVDPALLTELAEADPAAIEAVRAVLRAARRGD